MLKKEVREWVKYLVSQRKSFKVVFANGVVKVVEYRGYCWVIDNKGYNDNELVEKMVRFQNNEKKFIIRFEAIEEAEEAQESEEVENLTDDLFQESDIAYAEEAIERESNNISTETNINKYNGGYKMDKEVIIYYGINITERADKIFSKFTDEDIKRLKSKFQQAIISKEERNYRFLYKGYLIICTMSEHKNIIEVDLIDIYHI